MSELNFKSIGELPAVNELGDNGYIVVEENGVGKRLPASEVGGKFNILEVGWTESYDTYVIGLDGNPISDPAVLREMMLSAPTMFKTLAAVGMQNPDIPGYMYMFPTYTTDYEIGILISFQVGSKEVLVTVGESI